MSAHPAIVGRAGRWVATVAQHVRPGIDPLKAGQTASRLASLAGSALTGRAFAVSFGFASGDLLFDLLLLDLVFLALRYQPGFGPLAVAYAAANIASAIPLTPGGLGVIEVTLVAITVGFGAPRATAVLAVLGPRAFLGRELRYGRVAAGFSSQEALAARLDFDRTVIAKARGHCAGCVHTGRSIPRGLVPRPARRRARTRRAGQAVAASRRVSWMSCTAFCRPEGWAMDSVQPGGSPGWRVNLVQSMVCSVRRGGPVCSTSSSWVPSS